MQPEVDRTPRLAAAVPTKGRVLVAVSVPLSTFAGLQLVSVPEPSLGPPAGAGGDSMAAIISADGRYVAFASTARNLVLMTNRTRLSGLSPCPVNVFLRDRTNGTTTLVSVNLAGTGGGNSNSFPAGISTNGQFVLFESSSGDLVAWRHQQCQ